VTRAAGDERLAGFVSDPGFWQAALPALTIAGGSPAPANVPDEALRLAHRTIAEDGFLRIRGAVPGATLDRIRAGMTSLVEQGWPPSLIFLFEEPWWVMEGMRPLLASFLGDDYVRLAGFWAWWISRDTRAKGWARHRDWAIRSVREDGSLDHMTLWIAVTDATPENGCMYIVPASRDPNYHGDLDDIDVADPSTVRALPACAGTVLGWTSHLLHWGGRASPWAEGPRVSFSMEFQRRAVPLRNEMIPDAVPRFHARARWLGKQILAYAHLEPPGPALASLAARLIGT
jgi:hypothetical protein